jgi:tRNA threonylcarbamoyladenosine biosynthesis protein TsaB
VTRFQPPVCLLIDTASREGIVAIGPSFHQAKQEPFASSEPATPEAISLGRFGFEQVNHALSLMPIESVAWEVIPTDPGINRMLAPTIQHLLTRFSLPIDQVLPLAVVQGPGSFTGIRVGIATAKTLAYAASLSLLAVDALEALAMEGWLTAGRKSPMEIGVLMDAYRGEFFWGRWQWDQEGWRTIEPSRLLRAMEGTPRSQAGMQSILCGPGISVLDRRNQLLPWNQNGWLTLNDSIPAETSAQARLLLAHLLHEKTSTTDPFSLLPKYLRGSAAEEKAASSTATLPPGSTDE